MTMHSTSTLAADEHAARIGDLQKHMLDRGLAAIGAASPENVYYLTGLDHLGYFAFTLLVVPRSGRPVLVTREMERPTVSALVPHVRHVTYEDGADPAAVVTAVLDAEAPAGGAIALEDAAMFFPPSIHARVRSNLAGRDWFDCTSLLAEVRAAKSSSEIASMRCAARASDAAMAAAIAAATPGAPEASVAAAVYQAMFRTGAEAPGFAPLIRPLSLLDREHVTWGDRVLQPDSGLFVELGASVDRYHAPQSRTCYLGRASAAAIAAHRATLAGWEAAFGALRPGRRTGEIYAAWRAGYAALDPTPPQRHHCGYLVGIGFPPSWVGGGEVLGIRSGGRVLVTEGMTFHLMSWGRGHVMSDTVVVTADGAEALTTTARGLLEVS